MMEMMDIGTATKLFDYYTNLLEGEKAILIELRKRAQADPELAELAKSQAEHFEQSFREILTFSILFDRRLAQQASLAVMHPGVLAELILAKKRFTTKWNEIARFLDGLKNEQASSSHPREGAARPPAQDLH
jgi:hypothetical protein